MTPNLTARVNDLGFKFLVDHNADGILVLDERGVVLVANATAERLFGRPAALLIGSILGTPLVVTDCAELCVRRPDGTLIDAELRCAKVSWNERPAWLASLRDISARRLDDERSRHAAQIEAVGRLTAGIAHDFNNLLTVVLGNLDSARRQLTTPGALPIRAIDNAIHGARRAAVLTERLLTFARRKPLEPCVLDVNALVGGMSELLRRTLGEKINIRTQFGKGLWNVEADPTELETTILNLVVNARDAMPDGGDLVIETANFEADARLARANDMEAGRYVLICVTDSGTGIAPEMLQVVFEPFFTTKTHRGGTGLGLSQVYGFVKQSGGHVKLYSEPGRGTTAKIYLRVGSTLQLDEHSAIAEASFAPLARGSAHEIVLVVEDDADVRRYTVDSLTELGYTVLQAADALQALDILGRGQEISLLLTDLGLPGGVDGRGLVERARGARPQLPILMTSAYAGALIHDGRLDADVELLGKPFTLAVLAQRLRQLLDRRDTGAAVRSHVLIVEDEPLVRTFVTEMLADAGYEVAEAGTSHEATQHARARGNALTAIIVDLGLPDGSGADLAAELRALLPHVCVVLTTGRDVHELRQRFADDASVRILSKPFDRMVLLEALHAGGGKQGAGPGRRWPE